MSDSTLSKDPTADPAEHEAYFPSPYSLDAYTAPRTDWKRAFSARVTGASDCRRRSAIRGISSSVPVYSCWVSVKHTSPFGRCCVVQSMPANEGADVLTTTGAGKVGAAGNKCSSPSTRRATNCNRPSSWQYTFLRMLPTINV